VERANVFMTPPGFAQRPRIAGIMVQVVKTLQDRFLQ
jgi:hypothetical protein